MCRFARAICLAVCLCNEVATERLVAANCNITLIDIPALGMLSISIQGQGCQASKWQSNSKCNWFDECKLCCWWWHKYYASFEWGMAFWTTSVAIFIFYNPDFSCFIIHTSSFIHVRQCHYNQVFVSGHQQRVLQRLTPRVCGSGKPVGEVRRSEAPCHCSSFPMAPPPEDAVLTRDEQGADDGAGQRHLKWQSKQNATTYAAWSASPLFALRCVFLLLRATGSDAA